MKAMLVLNGDRVSKDIMYRLKDESDFILSADGGTDYCLDLGIVPNLIIGDLDSISSHTLEVIKELRIPVKKFPIKKDKTDSELSIEYLIDMGVTELIIVGALGSRMDHSMANILLLKKIKDKGIKGEIVHSNNTIYLVDDKLVLDKESGYFVSIIPIKADGITISLKGFEYELNKKRIDFSSTYGISNIIKDNKGYIKVYEGECLVFVSKD